MRQHSPMTFSIDQEGAFFNNQEGSGKNYQTAILHKHRHRTISHSLTPTCNCLSYLNPFYWRWITVPSKQYIPYCSDFSNNNNNKKKKRMMWKILGVAYLRRFCNILKVLSKLHQYFRTSWSLQYFCWQSENFALSLVEYRVTDFCIVNESAESPFFGRMVDPGNLKGTEQNVPLSA